MNLVERSVALVREHVGVMIALFSGITIALRLLAVAGGDLNSAFTILQSGGGTNALLGSGIGFIGFIPPMVALYVLQQILSLSPKQRKRSRRIEVYLIGLVAIIATYFLTPIMITAITVAYGALILVIFRVLKDKRPISSIRTNHPRLFEPVYRGSGFSIPRGDFIIGVLFCVSLYALFLVSLPWWPTEKLVLEGSRDARVVRVVGSTDQSLTVMSVDNSRTLSRLPVADIESRTLCAMDSERWITLSGYALLTHKKPEPKC